MVAARKLAERPDLGQGDLFLACATGDESAVRRAIADDPLRREARLLFEI